MIRRATVKLVAVAFVAAVGAVAAAAWMSTPRAASLERHVMERLSATGERPVPIAAVAPMLVRAVVATEDERFYRHHGIDGIGLLRAIPYDLVHMSFAQGASTITEQVAKLLYLGGNDHSLWRKLEDMALAVKLENRYTKAQLLDAYLNSAYFGAGAYGIRAASRRYFGVDPHHLTLAQASLLAGLPQAPSAYDPFSHPASARARQIDVLRSLVRVGAISTAGALRVLSRPLALRGSAVLPALLSLRAAQLEPGPPLAWTEIAIGAAVALAGGLLFTAGRRVREPRLASGALTASAVAALLFGAALALRSFRTL